MCGDVVEHLLVEGIDRCQGRSVLLPRLRDVLPGAAVGAGLEALRELHLTGYAGPWPRGVRVLYGHSFVLFSAILLNETPYSRSKISLEIADGVH